VNFSIIKSATVAIAKVSHDDRRIFEIVGSGVCVDSRGIILTCEHVINAFLSNASREELKKLSGSEPQRAELPGLVIPYAIFYKLDPDGRLLALQARVDQVMCSRVQDIGLVRVLQDKLFPDGYPCAQVEEYSAVHEGLEVGTCGFPLGNFLQGQIGAVTSSFTFGRVSTISPYASVEKENLKAFQLDLTATHGNSGGPVFNQATSKIIGVLQGGIAHPQGYLQPGLVRCEPLYGFLGKNEIEFLRNAPVGQLATDAELQKLVDAKGSRADR